MNTEYRNKFYNRIKDVFEKEKRKSNERHFTSKRRFSTTNKNWALNLQKQLLKGHILKKM